MGQHLAAGGRLAQGRSDVAVWRLKGCPHCGGDLLLALDDDTVWKCLQCGRELSPPRPFCRGSFVSEDRRRAA